MTFKQTNKQISHKSGLYLKHNNHPKLEGSYPASYSQSQANHLPATLAGEAKIHKPSKISSYPASYSQSQANHLPATLAGEAKIHKPSKISVDLFSFHRHSRPWEWPIIFPKLSKTAGNLLHHPIWERHFRRLTLRWARWRAASQRRTRSPASAAVGRSHRQSAREDGTPDLN